MPPSLSRVTLHTVFSTKDRFAFFPNPAFRTDVHAYPGGCAKSLDCLPLQIGGVSDHVHLLTTLPRTLSIADMVKEIKRVSTNWIQERGGEWSKFHWQSGYATFSVSESNLPQVISYIENQVQHHRSTTFQDEYRALLAKHGQVWNETYVWD